MKHAAYVYYKKNTLRYVFLSEGPKGIIEKAVEFAPAYSRNVFTLGFGDVTDGIVDDLAISDNKDAIKVISTVIKIVQEFTADHPNIKVVFAGSTHTRTRLYHRILKMHTTTSTNTLL